MSVEPRRFYVSGEWRAPSGTQADILEVRRPYDDELMASVFLASQSDADQAIERGLEGFEKSRQLQSYERADVLKSICSKLQDQKELFAELISDEAGKPLRFARAEVERAAMTFELAAEEAKRIHGEVLPLDLAAHARDRMGIVRRYPVGLVLAISPFNFPLNLVAHKVAPAIAAGCSFILKPPSQAPLTSLALAKVIEESGFPPSAFSVLPCRSSVAEGMVKDERIAAVSFTGSPGVGWALKTKAGKKRVVLELGGNAGVIIDASADVDLAVKKCVVGAFGYSGQVCIKIQRFYVHESLYDRFLSQFVAATRSIGVGDPRNERTVVGPVIDDEARDRILEWIDEAVAGGAKLVCGGAHSGRVIEPTVLENVPPESRVFRLEVFGPVATFHRVRSIDEGVSGVNDSAYGLQAAVFSNDLSNVLYAYRHLRVGGVIVNDSSTFRVDSMPYGGLKDSGFGREGVRYAIEEMTEPKLLVL